MEYYLVCSEPFDFNGVNYFVGQIITDPILIASLLINYAAYFVQIDEAQALGLIYLIGTDGAFLKSGVDGFTLGNSQ